MAAQPLRMTPMDENYTRISNDILDAMARTNFSAYESRFINSLWRKTYGFHKKTDRIALSQIAKHTGMKMPHVSRTKAKLIARNIVTCLGNEIGFNKYHTQWRELPIQVTVTRKGNTKKDVTDSGNGSYPDRQQNVTSTGNKKLPIQGDTKERKEKKEIFTKEMPNLKNEKTTTNDDRSKVAGKWTDEEILTMEKQFKKQVVENDFCDKHYADKTWEQHKNLRTDNRNEFFRKVDLMLKWLKTDKYAKRAKILFHEIAGFINDRGAMEKVLDGKEIQKRQRFGEDNKGESDDAELRQEEAENNESFL